MSSSSNLHRALSPHFDSVAQAILSTAADPPPNEDPEVTAINRALETLHPRISAARSVDDVLNVVYPDYADDLKPFLLTFAASAEKWEKAKQACSRLESALSSGNVPQRLRVKMPELQFTKEFRETTDDTAVAALKALKDAEGEAQSSYSKLALAAKKAEVADWADKCDTRTVTPEGTRVVQATWEAREKSFQSPIVARKLNGVIEVAGWTTSLAKKAEKGALERAIPLLCSQILRVVEIRNRALNEKIKKLADVAAKADVEMADATQSSLSPSVQSLIDRALNAKLKAMNLSTGSKKVRRPHLIPPTRANDYRNYTEYVWPEYLEGLEEQTRPYHFLDDVLVDSEAQAHQGQRQAQGPEEEEGREAKSGFQRSKEEGRRKGQRQGSRVNTRSVIVSPFRPNSIPDEVLTMTWDDAVSFVHLHTPLHIHEASRYRSIVHTSPGVSVPREISNDLSLGLKYMLFTPPSKKLLSQAWDDFNRRIRWRIYFSFKEGVDKPFDPDYYVDESKNAPGPSLPKWMEEGLKLGTDYVDTTSNNIPDSVTKGARKGAFHPKVKVLRQFLTDNNYVVTMTDKNLGLAVSERDWLIRNEKSLLHDPRNYRLLDKKVADAMMSEKATQLSLLSRLSQNVPLYEVLKLDKYFISLCTGAEHVYPQFYVIPKIHKTPTGFRPIIPCHSVCFNTAAKYCSKELKPIVQSTPSIIHGTKDLFTRLSQLVLDKNRSWYFVTGDVVAFYPNIPLEECIDIVSNMYSDWVLNNIDFNPDQHSFKQWMDNPRGRIDVFKFALETGNTKLIAQHGEEYYLQLNGLAMGVADSPDLANLFAAHFENKCGILHDPQVAFYGRYIDDCFAIVYADNEDNAKAIVADKVKYSSCTIEWNASASECQFLDGHLFKSTSGGLAWKPYVKAGNHRERIPWVSHHPLDVKRGVYAGECSRLAVLCSTKEIYMEAVRDLNSLYHTRGYPDQIVKSWCRTNIQERWEKRYASRIIPEHDEGVLVLKSQFDDHWNWFSATKLGETVVGYWKEWLERARSNNYSAEFPPVDPEDSHDINDVQNGLHLVVTDVAGETAWTPDLSRIGVLGRRWIVSRKRTTNILDLTNVWKKTVLRTLDEAVATSGGNSSTFINPPVTRTELPATVPSKPAGNTSDSDEDIILHRRSSPDVEMYHPEFGRMSKRTN